MPRYFFDIHDAQRFMTDDEGIECADFNGARREAVLSLPEIAKFAMTEDGDNQALSVLICEESGTVIYTATLTFVGLRLT